MRVFASEHGANPLTVAKAYQSLQDKGYVTVKRGIGMFVAEGATEQLRVDERAQFLDANWPKIRQHIARLDIEPAELARSHRRLNYSRAQAEPSKPVHHTLRQAQGERAIGRKRRRSTE